MLYNVKNMVDNNTHNDIQLKQVETSWYKEHVLTKEQLAKLIENKFNRAFGYQSDNKLLAR